FIGSLYRGLRDVQLQSLQHFDPIELSSFSYNFVQITVQTNLLAFDSISGSITSPAAAFAN
ncbi:MAG: hypothetical protein AAF485_20195, partial [Chloroflexota bacterium]